MCVYPRHGLDPNVPAMGAPQAVGLAQDLVEGGEEPDSSGALSERM